MPPHKLIIVGLDAADYGLTKNFIDDGDLPRLSSIRNKGNFSCLNSVVPPVTPPGWTTITTGVNPGKHGIYYFYNFSTSPATIVNATNSSTPRIWDYVQAADGRSVVVNVPVTYPVREISGTMIAGIPPWFWDKRSVYPETLFASLKTSGYQIDTPLGRSLESQPELFVRKLVETEEKRADVFLDLLKGEIWSFGMIVITALDRFQHKLVGKGTLESDQVRRGYREIDRLLGKIIDSAGEDVNVLVVSDHGFITTPVAFYPNSWLFRQGLLKRKSSAGSGMVKHLHNFFDGRFLWLPQSITKRFQGASTAVNTIDAVDLGSSRAFVPGTDGLVIVKSKDDMAAITNGLSEMKDSNGEKVCEVYPREKIYHGDRLESAPQLLIIPRDGVNIRSDPFSTEFVSSSGDFPRGNHGPKGIFFAIGPDIRKSEGLELQLEDVAPTALSLMGITPPDSMDGRIIKELMAGQQSTKSFEPMMVDRKAESYRFSKEEENQVMDNLRRLGYT